MAAVSLSINFFTLINYHAIQWKKWYVGQWPRAPTAQGYSLFSVAYLGKLFFGVPGRFELDQPMDTLELWGRGFFKDKWINSRVQIELC